MKKSIRLVLAGTLSVATLFGMSTVPSYGDPEAVARAKEELDRIKQEASAIDQEIIEASARADDAKTELEQLKNDVTEQEAKVADMSELVGEVAVMQMQTNGFDYAAQLVTSDSDENFLNRLATMHTEAERGNADVQAFQLEQGRLESLRQKADATSQQMQKDLEAKESLAKEFDEKEKEAKAIYDRLNAEEQERLRQLELQRQREQEERERREREEQQRAEEQRRAQESRQNDRSNQDSNNNSGQQNNQSNENNQSNQSSESSQNQSGGQGSSPAPAQQEAPAASGGGSNKAQIAVSAAKSKIGSPYVWGSAGPNTFDCSGLMLWSYKQAGISLSRTSRAQAGNGVPVSKGNLQPGDLVFYYSPISHVGMYIGNGQVVHAPQPGDVVKVSSVNAMPFTTARRVA